MKAAVTGLVGILMLGAVKMATDQHDSQQVITPAPSSQHEEIPSIATKPLHSNQWYSALYGNTPTQPLYAMPLAFVVHENGIALSYPQVTVGGDSVFAPFREDIRVLFPTAEKPVITSIGDWTLSFLQGEVTSTIGHGLPYIIINTAGKTLSVTSPSSFEEREAGDDFVVISVNETAYIVIHEQGTRTMDGQVLSFAGGQNKHMVIGVLPEGYTEHTIQEFISLKNLSIKSSAVSVDTNGSITTTYTLFTSDSGEPLLALYPHHQKSLNEQTLSLGTYETIRGKLTLTKTHTFTTTSNIIAPQMTFSRLENPPRFFTDALSDDIDSFLKSTPPEGVYFKGKWLAKGASLLQLANVHGVNHRMEELTTKVSDELNKSLDELVYDETKTSVIAKNTEFGNDELNDHHFHYGYYIRTAAVLKTLNRDVSEKAMNDLISDISETNRSSETFPYVRTFDWYEGHSWADGNGETPDGNNQESTSEAINAWYAVFMWGTVTNNDQLKNTGLGLYNMEIESAKTYWFDTANIYPEEYPHEIASLVWGGKIDYLTWFSPEANMKYGIQLMPFTPGSTYLGTFSEHDMKRFTDHWKKTGGSFDTPWGNMFRIWFSMYESQTVQVEQMKQDYKDEAGDTPFSLFAYFMLLGKNVTSQ